MKAFCGHLLSSKTLAEAAARAGITVRMATRWQRSEEFRDIFCGYFRADDLAIEQMAKSLSGPALAVAGKILTDPDAPATAKVQACAVINKFNIAYMRLNQLEARLKDLERKYAAMPKRGQS